MASKLRAHYRETQTTSFLPQQGQARRNKEMGEKDRVDGIPSHGGSLLGVRGVVSRLVQDRDAYVPIWVHVGMPDRRCKCHLGRSVGVVLRKLELAIENASLTVLLKTSQPEACRFTRSP
jgi:hypothetical protein